MLLPPSLCISLVSVPTSLLRQPRGGEHSAKGEEKGKKNASNVHGWLLTTVDGGGSVSALSLSLLVFLLLLFSLLD